MNNFWIFQIQSKQAALQIYLHRSDKRDSIMTPDEICTADDPGNKENRTVDGNRQQVMLRPHCVTLKQHVVLL